jgi:hypothetical protein
MDNTTPQNEAKRTASRKTTEAFVTCRPFTSSGSQHSADGVLRNFSSNGFYLEASRPYASGTILLMRTVHYPPTPPLTADEKPRSICLAEVKWMQTLTSADTVRYGIGGRYLGE